MTFSEDGEQELIGVTEIIDLYHHTDSPSS